MDPFPTTLIIILSAIGITVAGQVNGKGECPSDVSPALIRYSRMRSTKASWSIKTDLRRCSDLCKRNIDSSGRSFPCSGFNLHSAPVPLCEFYTVEQEDRPLEWTSRDNLYYYSKTCLNVSLECRPSVFSFDVLPSLSLQSPILTALSAMSADHCMQLCLQLNCPSARFDSTTSECLLLNETLRTGSFEKNTNVVHLENHCLPHPLVCPSGRIISTLLKNSDIAPFGFFAGVMSVRDCQRECIHSRLFLCRSFLFSSHSSECHLSPETSQLAVPSEKLHLYEMVCIPSMGSSPIDRCNRPYSFERIPTMRSVSDAVINTMRALSSEACISSCLIESSCLSFNYDVRERKCTLLSTSRESPVPSTLMTDENSDYFELACPRFSFPSSSRERQPPPRVARPRNESPPFDPSRAFLLLKSTSFSSHSFDRHLHISPLSRCQNLCSQRENCSSFAYSVHRRECLLSPIPLRKQSDLTQFTTANSHFDLYVYPRHDEMVLSFPTLLPNATTMMITHPTTTTTVPSTTSPPPPSSPSPPSESSPTPFIFASTPSLFDDSIFETPLASTENPMQEQLLSTTSKVKEEESTMTTTEIPSTTTTEVVERGMNQRPAREWEGGDSPPIRLSSSEGVGVVPKGSIHVEADCMHHGVNITVTFNSTVPYTGAIYAIDRYSECGVYGRESKELSLFVPRPKHNTVCNAVEIGGQLAVLIVVSSDSIVPHSVTTSEDTFFHIKCQYPREERNKAKGTVKGSSLRSNQVRMREEPTKTKVWLELMRDGKEVHSAAIGERLVARLKSALPADRIRVSECTATRSEEESTGDSPISVPLISHGCPLIPHIMSGMRLHDGHWEADLSVFRLEGSRHVDIVCLVQLCTHALCPPIQDCEQGRGRRETTEEKGESLRAQGRIEINGDINESFEQWPLCIEFSTYFLLLVAFFSLLISFVFSCVFTRIRSDREIRRLTNELQSSSSIPRMTSLSTL